MTRRQRSGFTLVECAFAGAVVVVALALLGLMAGRTRKLGQLGESMANLRRVGELTGSYAADYQDKMWSYSWRPGMVPADADPDLRALVNGGNDTSAAAAQAIQIIRRRGNEPNFEPVDAWIPHVIYNHLVLVDYAQSSFPVMWMLSPGDRNRVNWATNIPGFRQGVFGQNQPPGNGFPPDPSQWRWSYSGSYDLSYAFYSPDSGDTVSQGANHTQYFVPNGSNVLGRRTLPEVVYPSQKAMMWDMWGWYFGRRVDFSCIIGARFPVLFADGGAQVRVRKASVYPTDVTWGWDPRRPTSLFPLSFLYEPRSWEPSTPNGQVSITVQAGHRWTRRGLQGRDFDANEP